ncbi:MAG: helix-turn-helix transcriptional regulator [Lachnospiraceae bacterium]|nr:helix-turn-helix transcriptional regulator [Lachnospiraceae bacterium]
MISIGEQIVTLVNDNSHIVSLRQLSKGLCSKSAINNIVTGGNAADPRLLKLLLQRVGKSQNKLEFVATKEFIDIARAQSEFDDCIDSRNSTKASELLRKLETIYCDGESVSAVKMYNLRNNAAYRYYINNDVNGALELIQKAIAITVPQINKKRMLQLCLSSVEIENLLFMCFMKVKAAQSEENTTECRRLVNDIFEYIEKKVTDREEAEYILPKAKWVSANLYLSEGNPQKAVSECDEGLILLRKSGFMQMMLPMLEIIIRHGEKCELSEPYDSYRNYKEMIDSVCDRFLRNKARLDSLFLEPDRAVYHYEAEVYRGQRRIKKMTQEDVAEIANTNFDSVSRYENGKRSPQKNKYLELANALNLNYAKQSTSLICENFSILEAEQTMRELLINENFQLLEEKLDVIEKKINCSFISNQALIAYYRNWIGLRKGIIDPLKVIQIDSDIIEKEYPILSSNVIRPPFLWESRLLAQVYSCLMRMGKKDEAEVLLKKVLDTISDSYVDRKQMNRIYGVHAGNYFRQTIEKGGFEEFVEYSVTCRYCKPLDNAFSSYAAHIYNDNRILSKEYAILSLCAAQLCKSPNIPRISEFIEKWYTD